MKPRVHVVIPAFNEAESIALVLRGLKSQPQEIERIIVVDNASTDSTAIIARQLGALVVEEKQRGYGAACLRGLSELSSRLIPHPRCLDIVVFIDADYSDYPEELGRIIAPIVNAEAEFVVGSRLQDPVSAKAVPVIARFGNTFATWVIRKLYGMKFSDMGPFRAISWEALEALGMKDRTWGWTLEMQIKAARMKLPSSEVSVRYRSRHSGKSKISQSFIGALRAGSKILWVLAKYSLAPVEERSISSRSSQTKNSEVEKQRVSN